MINYEKAWIKLATKLSDEYCETRLVNSTKAEGMKFALQLMDKILDDKEVR